ncbi:hypothetical protein [Aureimonas pseudogalii]|uniref:Uncharacterized protein n=1 Tax=Aureimonas pseudogalii TaxID=1744844 RepID=A0A7W6H466_9HYPH|nr:hypothetical protein [Aureimonas pseudogalii]MBB3997862.1 hypothetical protein [Aureimonas pseudogalii]
MTTRHIKINSSRAAQLRVLATKTKISVSTLIEHLINDRVAAGEIPDRFDGLAITRRGDLVAIVIAGKALPLVSLGAAQHLARAFGQMLAGEAGAVICVSISGHDHVECRRVGTAYRLAWIKTDAQTSVAAFVATRTMLGDVIRQLGEAVR